MLRIGGHSKGGNLAMYAAMQCSDILQEKLLSVYDNDGPGFPEGFSVPEEWKVFCQKSLVSFPRHL